MNLPDYNANFRTCRLVSQQCEPADRDPQHCSSDHLDALRPTIKFARSRCPSSAAGHSTAMATPGTPAADCQAAAPMLPWETAQTMLAAQRAQPGVHCCCCISSLQTEFIQGRGASPLIQCSMDVVHALAMERMSARQGQQAGDDSVSKYKRLQQRQPAWTSQMPSPQQSDERRRQRHLQTQPFRPSASAPVALSRLQCA